jgi:hypothetical protein
MSGCGKLRARSVDVFVTRSLIFGELAKAHQADSVQLISGAAELSWSIATLQYLSSIEEES